MSLKYCHINDHPPGTIPIQRIPQPASALVLSLRTDHAQLLTLGATATLLGLGTVQLILCPWTIIVSIADVLLIDANSIKERI